MRSFRFLSAVPAILLMASCSYGPSREACESARKLYYSGRYVDSARAWGALQSAHPTWKTLFDLEIGSAALAARQYETSSRHLEAASDLIEVIDFTTDDYERLGKVLFSESSGLFRARPHEKVFLSILNLLDHAARGKLDQARTEANLLSSTVDGIERLQPTVRIDSPLVFLLIGLIDEITETNRPGQALISYNKAYRLWPDKSLKRAMDALKAREASGGAGTRGVETGELVVFVLNGRAPIFEELQVNQLSEEEKVYYKDVLLADGLTRIASAVASAAATKKEEFRAAALAYLARPSLRLAAPKKRATAYSEAELVVSDRQSGGCGKVLDLEKQVLDWYESVRSKIIRAALSRAVFRAAAAVAAQASVEAWLQNTDVPWWLRGIISQSVGVLVREALYAADTPDTRCWSLLPREVFFHRVSLKPGEYDVSIGMQGPGGAAKKLDARRLTIRPGEFTFGVWVCHDDDVPSVQFLAQKS